MNDIPEWWVDELLHGLITCAVWAECSEYNEDEEGYEEGDILNCMDADNFAPPALAFLRNYCLEFARKFAGFCENIDQFRVRDYDPNQGTLLEYAGHDLWLTSRGHGAGFWDGDWEKSIGDQMTEWCGDLEIYLGDDRLIYVSGEENYGGKSE